MDVVRPDYSGGGTINLVASIARHFGADLGNPPCTAPIDWAGVDAVVLLIVDALGWLQIEKHLADGDMPHLAALIGGEARLARITTTFPPTTAVALTTLHTGATPAVHGILGFALWLPEEQTVGEMLRFHDLVHDRPLARPERLMSVPSVYSRLAAAGVPCRVVAPGLFRSSLLSGWHFAGAEYVPLETANSLPSRAAEALAGSGPRYVVAYWPGYDGVCHWHGPVSPQAGDEIAAVDLAIHRLIERLPSPDRTLVLVTGDHGQRALDPADAILLNDDTRLNELIWSPPFGERCGRGFNVRPGMLREAVEHLSPVAESTPMDAVWAADLFGGPPAREEYRLRRGDLLAIPRGRRQLHWAFRDADRGTIYRGGHGGLTAAEMWVPVIAIRR